MSWKWRVTCILVSVVMMGRKGKCTIINCSFNIFLWFSREIKFSSSVVIMSLYHNHLATVSILLITSKMEHDVTLMADSSLCLGLVSQLMLHFRDSLVQIVWAVAHGEFKASFYLFISPLPSVPSVCSHRHLLLEIYKAINSLEGGGQRIRTEERGEKDNQGEREMERGWNGQREKLLIVGIKTGAQIECKQEIVWGGRGVTRETDNLKTGKNIAHQIQRDTHGSENPISPDPKGQRHKWLIPKKKQCLSQN